MSFLGQKAHGLALYYKEDCVTLDHTAEFRSGVKIDPR